MKDNLGALPRAVRVSVPVSVAADLDKFKSVIQQTLARLGCPSCCSGFDILLQQEREFVFDKQRIAHSPVAAIAESSGTANISLSLAQGAGGNLKSVLKGIDRLADRLGCQACCSGFDLHLRDSLVLFANDAGKLIDAPGN